MKPALLFFGAAALAACTSGNVTPPAPDASVPDAQVDGYVKPPSPTCTGDTTVCLTGTLSAQGFTTPMVGGIVELYRVYPAGNVQPVDSQAVDASGAFAFSSRAPWGHYFIKGTAHFGSTTATAASVPVYGGRFVVPVTGGPIALVAQPAELEITESGSAGGRSLVLASARVFDPATAKPVGTAMVTVGGDGIAPLAMAYQGDATHAYLVQPQGVAGSASGYTFAIAYAGFAGGMTTFHVAPAASFAFGGAITAPASGASVPAMQDLAVTWTTSADPDYQLVALFVQSKSQLSDPLPADATKLTVPGAWIGSTGSYLLNVDAARVSCDGKEGCATLLETASTNFTAQ